MVSLDSEIAYHNQILQYNLQVTPRTKHFEVGDQVWFNSSQSRVFFPTDFLPVALVYADPQTWQMGGFVAIANSSTDQNDETRKATLGEIVAVDERHSTVLICGVVRVLVRAHREFHGIITQVLQDEPDLDLNGLNMHPARCLLSRLKHDTQTLDPYQECIRFCPLSEDLRFKFLEQNQSMRRKLLCHVVRTRDVDTSLLCLNCFHEGRKTLFCKDFTPTSSPVMTKTCMNQFGRVFSILLLSDIATRFRTRTCSANLVFDEYSHTDHSWFPGYSWHFAS